MIPSYAKRLSHNPDKGAVGLPELFDTDAVKLKKFAKLASFFKESKRVVCLTGAGISTSAGIADFRGPNGVWTKEASSTKQRKRKRTKVENAETGEEEEEETATAFEQAKPTRTHEILRDLHQANRIHFVISQNVDGLHLRSGFPREALVELHGNVFLERCPSCAHEVFHERDLGGVGCLPTGRKCSKCDGQMRDTVLDWDTPIDEDEMQRAEAEVGKADLILCLGTSLRIVPAAELPLLVGTQRTDDIEPRICIVNLQKTPLDANADLVIRCRVDEIMEHVWANLNNGDAGSDDLIQTLSTGTSRPRRACRG